MDNPEDGDRLLPLPEAPHMLGDIGRTSIYKLMDNGDLESVKILDRRMITLPSIKRLIKRSAA